MLLFGLYISFTDWNLSSIDGRKFNGLDNFYQMISDLDEDGSGAIDFEEFLDMMTARMSDKDSREDI